jgi:hypothetical protein
MAAIVGYAGSVKVGASGGTSSVAQLNTWEMPLGADLYDVTVFGDQWKDYLPGLVGSDIKIDGFLDPTDSTGQVLWQTGILTGASILPNLYTTVSHYFSGTAYMKTLDIKTPVNAPIALSITATFSGQISYT